MVRRRRLVALGILILVAAAISSIVATLAGGTAAPRGMTTAVSHHKAKPLFRPRPREIRGVHVTMGLAGLPGKIDTYLRMRSQGLNTLEVDVKDERPGRVLQPVCPARAPHRCRPVVLQPVRAGEQGAREARLSHRADRRVPGSHPLGAAARLRDQEPGRIGLAQRDRARLDEHVRHPGLEVRGRSRARGRQGGLRRDPVRLRPLPHRRRRLLIQYPRQANEKKGVTIGRFAKYAATRLHRAGSGSAPTSSASPRTATWGSARSRKIGRYVDTISPMAYPSHYTPGEYNIADPDAAPARPSSTRSRTSTARSAGGRPCSSPGSRTSRSAAPTRSRT